MNFCLYSLQQHNPSLETTDSHLQIFLKVESKRSKIEVFIQPAGQQETVLMLFVLACVSDECLSISKEKMLSCTYLGNVITILHIRYLLVYAALCWTTLSLFSSIYFCSMINVAWKIDVSMKKNSFSYSKQKVE